MGNAIEPSCERAIENYWIVNEQLFARLLQTNICAQTRRLHEIQGLFESDAKLTKNEVMVNALNICLSSLKDAKCLSVSPLLELYYLTTLLTSLISLLIRLQIPCINLPLSLLECDAYGDQKYDVIVFALLKELAQINPVNKEQLFQTKVLVQVLHGIFAVIKACEQKNYQWEKAIGLIYEYHVGNVFIVYNFETKQMCYPKTYKDINLDSCFVHDK